MNSCLWMYFSIRKKWLTLPFKQIIFRTRYFKEKYLYNAHGSTCMHNSTCLAVLSGEALMLLVTAAPADPSRIIMNIPATIARSLFLSLSLSLSLALTVRQHLFLSSQVCFIQEGKERLKDTVSVFWPSKIQEVTLYPPDTSLLIFRLLLSVWVAGCVLKWIGLVR